MQGMESTYPDEISSTAEEREFDSFLLNYITEQAIQQRSPKVRLIPDDVISAWEEHKATAQY